MIDRILTLIFGSQNDRDVKKLKPVVAQINAKESWAQSLSESDFKNQTEIFKQRLQNGETLNDILPEAFALAREAANRVLGERAYDVQLMGSLVLHSGRITEMKTGEGKTLMCVPAVYLNALTGKGVHVVTVNDYLAERDADWMRPVYSYLGLTVGSILSNMDNDARKKSYACDITYGTNNEFGFDYLRDNMQIDMKNKVQRGFNFCVVDEIDSILIDEARTPLIISGQGEDDTYKYHEVDKYINQLTEMEKDPKTGDYPDEVDMDIEQRKALKGDYKLDEKSKRVSFTDKGINHIDEILHAHNLISQDSSVVDEENFEYVHYFTQALRAHTLYKINVDYLVRDGQVQIVDEFTGRVLEGRRYGDGLHQAIEAKEHLKIAQRNRTLATITFQNFFRMYEKLSGMTGTAQTEQVEFNKIYNLDVVAIPTNKPVARIDENDEVYLNESDKWEAIAKEIKAAHEKGQPVLVGTVSVEKSEVLSAILTKKGIRHEVLNAKNHAREALIIAEAGAKGAVTIATNMAGRGTDIKLGGNPEFRARKRAGTDASKEQFEAALKIEKEKWLKDNEEVKNAGGLYVIGSERHESRRIDNQLRGRSGRQGDPGRSKFFISMDDDLMRLFGGEKMKVMMTRIGMQPGEPIDHPWLNKGIEKAQQKVEDRNFEIRKHLLDYDDVLNEQRTVIYEQRDEILKDENLADRIMNNARDEVESLFSEYSYASRKTRDNSQLIQELNDKIKNLFAVSLPQERLNQDALISVLQNDLTEKETLAGKENLNMFIRYQYVQVIDKKWLDQLQALESLREAVSLRSYGSKNPLTEYKNDGFDMFDEMLDSIRTQVMSRVFKVRVQLSPEAQAQRKIMAERMQQKMNAQHSEAQSISQVQQRNAQTAMSGESARRQAQNSVMQSRTQSSTVTVRRSSPKVGRNDPCPCGSGKKYKQCCGRN
ncbi:MAG: preprotein translocase subunit SecA [Spirochaetia bacterium]|nr:preprotein translocase subunit SecA [Spirochaetia bacterium]MCI7563768.1 preprotein translocase subunit SecA [Spirochaetia bacterium]MCI7798921.1 preprotein translocase subunit SecA [Spirochaetia bacterium]MDD5776454.1 preprotein translocase subunit SecA [Treponema sp.]MDY5831231.1 preprotein translocase subunit SecA [Treponema sp.]